MQLPYLDRQAKMALTPYSGILSTPTMNMTSASSQPRRAMEKSSASLSVLVYFSWAGSSGGLGGLEEVGRVRTEYSKICTPM